MAAPRCVNCGYVLSALPAGNCPVCGKLFDPNDPTTFTSQPLFPGFGYWLPGFLTALIAGWGLYVLLIESEGFGFTVTLVLPFCVGILIGFGCRVSAFVQVLLALIAMAGIIGGLFSLSLLGTFCALITAGVALGPLLLGTLGGAFLRHSLRHSNWKYRHLLPVICALLVPLLGGAVEFLYLAPFPDETESTTVILHVSTDRAWNAVMYYEEIHLPLPFLMRIALPRPLYTIGSTEHVGDTKVCVYSGGRLVKRIVQRIPNQLLTFDVVEQTRVENQSVRLKRGSFIFTALSPDQTQVTLVTQYQPLLGPRWAWRWSERLGMTTLHGYVLQGMKQKAINDKSVPQPHPQPPTLTPPPGGAS